jgi:hypothetical protein
MARVEKTGKKVLAAALCLFALAAGCASLRSGDWRTASHAAVGSAPDPAVTKEAVVQVYAARAFGWRGLFGVHTWVAAKPANASTYTVYEVIGWRARWNDSVVAIHDRTPDSRWYGAAPELLADKRGAAAEPLIARIDNAARAYPWKGEYTIWPGPNSNTFTAWITRAVPELQVDLPPTAIGKDYLGGSIVGPAPSGRGYQLSLGGLLGVAASPVDGLEFNLLGLNFGASAWGIKLPFFGTLGPTRTFAVAPAAAPSGQP